jgi:hypothetical protein
LNLVDHDVVYFRSVISSKSHKVKNVVDSIHNIVASIFNFPSLVLTKCLKNVQFLLLCQKYISWLLDVNLFRQILTSIHVRWGWTFNSGVYFSPNELRSDISRRIEPSIDIGPEMSRKVVIVNLKGHIIVGFFCLEFFC